VPTRGVATKDDVTATAGTKPVEGAAPDGIWKAGTITTTAHPHLRAGGGEVIHEASCTFDFSGHVDGGTAPKTGNSTVTLTATARRLQHDRGSVLVDGDRASDRFGNTLSVASTRTLRCAH
jgi:hypothetical protein